MIVPDLFTFMKMDHVSFPVSLANETNSPSSEVHIDYYIE